MKITLINHSDTQGGASVVAFRLMEALRAQGVDARMLVGRKNSESPFVEQFEPSSRVPFYKEHLRIFTHNGFSRHRLFQVSIATDGLSLGDHPLVREADAVILHWVNQGLLSLDEIKKIAQMKPTFWTMHDQWNFTGICHHTGGCSRFTTQCCECPFLGWMKGCHDLSNRVFKRKQALYGSADITFIAVSEWLASRARQSTLMSGQKLAVIPNAFPIEKFSGSPAYSKEYFGLPDDKKLVLFCAARIDDPGKGLPAAIEMLNGLDATHGGDVMAVFVGGMRDSRALDGLRLPWRHIPPVSADKMPSLMTHASVVLSTSPFETLSTTMIEAQAAGATPVCYTHDGRGDIVTDRVNGYSLPADSEGAAAVLREAVEHPIDAGTLRSAAERYAASTIARRYIELIESRR